MQATATMPRDAALKRIQEFAYAPGDGSLSPQTLEYMAQLGPNGFKNSAETGCGRSTLLLSHLSAHHTVFTYSEEEINSDSNIGRLLKSDLFNKKTTHFVYGPSQKTVPQHSFTKNMDFVLIDGPHAFPFPELEYYYFYPHIVTGGILAIDDIHIPTLRNLFQVLCADEMWELLRVVDDKTAFFQRTKAPTANPAGGNDIFPRYNRLSYPATPFGNLKDNPPYDSLLAIAEAIKPCYEISYTRRIYVWGTGRFGRMFAELSYIIGFHIDGYTGTTAPEGFPHGPFYSPDQIPVNRPFFVVAASQHKAVVTEIQKRFADYKKGFDYVVLPFHGSTEFKWAL